MVVAALTIGLTAPTAAQATAVDRGAASVHGATHAPCTGHRRPVAIAPRMIDKDWGPTRKLKTCR